MQTKIIQWDFDAWEDYLYWQTQDKKMLKKINQLVKDISRKYKNGKNNAYFIVYKEEPRQAHACAAALYAM